MRVWAAGPNADIEEVDVMPVYTLLGEYDYDVTGCYDWQIAGSTQIKMIIDRLNRSGSFDEEITAENLPEPEIIKEASARFTTFEWKEII